MIKQIVVFIFISAFLGLSQTAGVGGGPLVNIFLMIGMGYDTKLSISITYIFLIGGSIASIWKNSTKKNPQTGASYVNLDLIILTVPTMTSGSLFGTVLKHFLSELFITIFFIVLFVYLITDIRKNLAKIKKDQHASLFLLNGTTKSKLMKLEQREMNNVVNPYAESMTPQPIQQQPSSTSSSRQNKLTYLIKLVAGYYVFTALASLCKGGPRHDSILGIDPCGFWGFAILIIHAGVSAWVSFRSANKIISENANIKKPTGQISINADNVLHFVLAGFCAGMVGATLAIGGALILIPVWLKLGIDKDVAASSTATLIMTSALVAATVSFFNQVYEQISTFLLFFYFVLAFVSAAVVKDFLTYLSNKYKLKSLVLWLLLIVVVISLVVLVPFQGYKMITDFERFSEFSTLC